MVYYKSLSDSNGRENDYNWAFFIQTNFILTRQLIDTKIQSFHVNDLKTCFF